MSDCLRKCLYWLFPPCKELKERKSIDSESSGTPAQRLELIKKDVREMLSENVVQDGAESLAHLVFESETKRKATIENKSIAFLFAVGVAVGVSFSAILVLAVLFSNKLSIPGTAFTILMICYIAAIIHLLVAAYYVLKAWHPSEFSYPSTEDFNNAVQAGSQQDTDRIVMYVSQAKFNEPVLIKKVNFLSVATTMLYRGLVLVAVAAISVIAMLLC